MRPTRKLCLPKLRPAQLSLYQQRQRFNVWVAHRRLGKTVLCLETLLAEAAACRRPNPRYAYFAPQRDQAKDIAWTYLMNFTTEIPGVDINQAELRVTLPHNGAQIRLYGCDRYGLGRSRRGIYLDGVCIDEFADIPPVIWSQVIRPMLVDRQGWCIFIGTPHGKNHFHQLYMTSKMRTNWSTALLRADETSVIPEQELTLLRQEAEDEGKLADFEQEFLCSWDTPMPGAVYAEQLRQIDQQGRLGHFPPLDNVPVCTGWDIGPAHTAIWWFQQTPQQVRFIDYWEGPGSLDAHIALVQHKPYCYDHAQMVPPLTRTPFALHYGPHDLEDSQDYATPKTRLGIALGKGMRFTVVPRGALEDGIEATRVLLRRSVFHERACEEGLNALRSYRYERNEIAQVYRLTPVHDWASHGADALRTAAVGLGGIKMPLKPPVHSGSGDWWGTLIDRPGKLRKRPTFRVGV